MSDVSALVRPEIRDLRPYRAAQYTPGFVRLNANETPWAPSGEVSDTALNRYPAVRPVELATRLSEYYGVQPEQLLVTRGSSEAIDLLIRCFCRPDDAIIICPPTFGMYEVYAQLQGARVEAVPLIAEQGYSLDMDGLKRTISAQTKLLFLCSPNNPTGNALSIEEIETACKLMRDKGVVVVDGAYVEFADDDPTHELLNQYDNVVVLRTLSKAFGLAGVRCGAALASPGIVDYLDCILPPYSFSSPCTDAALQALDEIKSHAARIELLRQERARVAKRLADLDGVEFVYPSAANFLLVKVADAQRFVRAAKAGRVLIRDFSWDGYSKNCLRITIGSEAQNDQLLAALIAG